MGGLENNQESEGFCPERLLCSPLLAQSPSLPCASPARMESSSEQLLFPDGLCSLGVRRGGGRAEVAGRERLAEGNQSLSLAAVRCCQLVN